MPTETEKEFFKAFGIEPIIEEEPARMEDGDGELCAWYINEYYPEITDRILLELTRICLNEDFVIHSINLDEYKEKVLSLLVKNVSDLAIYVPVRSLFRKGVNNE